MAKAPLQPAPPLIDCTKALQRARWRSGAHECTWRIPCHATSTRTQAYKHTTSTPNHIAPTKTLPHTHTQTQTHSDTCTYTHARALVPKGKSASLAAGVSQVGNLAAAAQVSFRCCLCPLQQIVHQEPQKESASPSASPSAPSQPHRAGKGGNREGRQHARAPPASGVSGNIKGKMRTHQITSLVFFLFLPSGVRGRRGGQRLGKRPAPRQPSAGRGAAGPKRVEGKCCDKSTRRAMAITRERARGKII